MRRLVSVREVNSIHPIEGADAIELAIVGGWGVVVKKGEFSPGDLGVFFEIDSFLPIADDRFEFLAKNAIKWNGQEGIRIKSIRLRGQLSQGLILPLNVFPEIASQIVNASEEEIDAMDFSELLKVVKWEPMASVNLGGQARGNFPSFISKTDQDRYQGLAKVFCKIAEHNRKVDIGELSQSELITFEVSIKLDGSSLTGYVCPNREAEGVCSRNIDLAPSDENTFWKIANQYQLIESIKTLIASCDGGNIADSGLVIQGEMFGAGINGNHEGITDIQFRVFDLWVPISSDGLRPGRYLTPEERTVVLNSINQQRDELGLTRLETAPILNINYRIDSPDDFDAEGNLDIEKIMNRLQELSEGPSLYAPTREGVVLKSNRPLPASGNMNSPFTFKAISNSYLLKHSDRG